MEKTTLSWSRPKVVEVEKEPLKLGKFSILQWYKWAFMLLGMAFFVVLVLEGSFFLAKHVLSGTPHAKACVQTQLKVTDSEGNIVNEWDC